MSLAQSPEFLRIKAIESGELVLQGHIARANPLSKQDIVGDVIAIFQGPGAYISPNWYPSKKVHGKVVPTWNYAAVHAKGKLQFIDDPTWKLNFLNMLTNEQESGQDSPWSVSDAPAEFVHNLLGSIVGFEIAVKELSGKWKLSQNQPEENRAGVVAGLTKEGDSASKTLALFMNQ